MPTAKTHRAPPITRTFTNDGRIPNDPLPLVLYRDAVDLTGSPDPERIIGEIFRDQRLGEMWRNRIDACTRYLSMIYETLGVARGRATVSFGGESGEAIDVGLSVVVILLSGVGHQCLAPTDDLVVVGAYPSSGTYNLCRAARPSTPRRLSLFARCRGPKPIRCLGRRGR